MGGAFRRVPLTTRLTMRARLGCLFSPRYRPLVYGYRGHEPRLPLFCRQGGKSTSRRACRTRGRRSWHGPSIPNPPARLPGENRQPTRVPWVEFGSGSWVKIENESRGSVRQWVKNRIHRVEGRLACGRGRGDLQRRVRLSRRRSQSRRHPLPPGAKWNRRAPWPRNNLDCSGLVTAVGQRLDLGIGRVRSSNQWAYCARYGQRVTAAEPPHTRTPSFRASESP